MLTWEDVREEFGDSEGNFRDIYVFKTDRSTWQRVIDALRVGPFQSAYFLDSEIAPLPIDVGKVFASRSMVSTMLSVTFAGVTANCHFFTDTEIEFDIDSREVDGGHSWEALIGFMGHLADAARQDCVMTPENCPETVIFRVRPGASEVEYTS